MALPTGEVAVWSAADGARGTRWREAIERDKHLVRSLLLEVAPDGTPTRLELTTTAGLLTLHPEPDGSALHGNVVTPSGIRHLAFAWSNAHVLLVEGSPVADAVAAGTRGVGDRAGEAVDGVRIGDDLVPVPGRWPVPVDRLGNADTWPLEHE